ncbi:hypothetical protein HAX54_039056 [Datura stramonium]|uniref:Uncharacterized protein n=1 Tax=Datura stramonium TaxID=4076 RepID=A0ABS8SIU3_DATST|nr:hypothetical protein [Datura stramonium]
MFELMSQLMERRASDRLSLASLSNQGGARKRIERTEASYRLQDENTKFEGEIKESHEGDLLDGSSSSGNNSDSDEGSGNKATNSPPGDSGPMKGYIIMGKMLGFRDSLSCQVKRAEKQFQEGLTTTTRGHLKRNITEVGGASSSSTPLVEGHITRATVSLESQTLVTSPPIIEVALPDPLSAAVTTDAIAKVPRAAPPQKVVPESRE